VKHLQLRNAIVGGTKPPTKLAVDILHHHHIRADIGLVVRVKRRSTCIETKRSQLASERPPKNGVASKNAFRSGELIAIDKIYSRDQRWQAAETSTLLPQSTGRAR
jgi:hypothetical protein